MVLNVILQQTTNIIFKMQCDIKLLKIVRSCEKYKN